MSTLAFGMSAGQTSSGRIADLVSQYAEQAGWNEYTTMRVNLLVEELATNVRDHGERQARSFEVTITDRCGRVKLEFRDDGIQFDPTRDAPDAQTDADLWTRGEGGMGVHLIRCFTDRFEYRYEDGKNVVLAELQV